MARTLAPAARKKRALAQINRIENLLRAADWDAFTGPELGGVLDDLRIVCDDMGDDWQERSDAKARAQKLREHFDA